MVATVLGEPKSDLCRERLCKSSEAPASRLASKLEHAAYVLTVRTWQERNLKVWNPIPISGIIISASPEQNRTDKIRIMSGGSEREMACLIRPRRSYWTIGWTDRKSTRLNSSHVEISY